MRSPHRRKERPPLTATGLEQMALRYVERFATTRARLADYLRRKLRERGWDGDGEAPVDALAERFADLGYVNDEAYALSKARALTGRGYGGRRVDQALRQAGVGEADGRGATQLAREEAVAAALRFARRRRIGPYAGEPKGSDDRAAREKAIAAMIRAGHEFGLARAIVELPPGAEFDPESLAQAFGHFAG